MTIEKLDMTTPNITDENVARIAELFPNVVTEGRDENGKLTHVVDFDALKQELSDSIVEGPQERYRLDWPGKRESMLAANTPITKTLRPVREESVDFDTTKNLFIEGDNLDALKLLQETYLGKVKMIYIDPPYNTGNDLIYLDNFRDQTNDYLENSGQLDEDGGRLVANPESGGRYHSDWLSMIYPRLKLARNLLRDDGIFIASIDNNEVANAVGILKEVFGGSNVVGIIANINNPKGRSDDKFFATSHEYLIAVAKSTATLKTYGFEPDEKITKRYNKFDDQGKRYREMDLRKTGDSDRREDRPDMFYYFYFDEKNSKLSVEKKRREDSNLIEIIPLRDDGSYGRWRWGYDTAKSRLPDVFAKLMPKRQIWTIVEKDFLDGRPPVKPTTSWTFKDVNSERGSEAFVDLGFQKEVFSRPKPIGTMERILKVSIIPDEVSLVIDLFSGSGSLAEATMRMGINDKRMVNIISVQLPEEIDASKKETRFALDFCKRNNLPAQISEISKERIRRAGKKILEDNPDQVGKLDVGFRVLKIDSSNMNDVYYAPGELDQGSLLDAVEHIKSDRTAEDLLFQVMLDWGVDLSLPIVREQIDGKTVFWVGDDDLAACFDLKISEDIVKTMAERKPLRAVFRDDGFGSDDMKINAGQLFAQMTDGHTDMKVI